MKEFIVYNNGNPICSVFANSRQHAVEKVLNMNGLEVSTQTTKFYRR
jgi:hypothetical protein